MSSVENKRKIWIIVAVIVIGIVLAITLGIYTYRNGGISNTNIVNTQKLAEVENQFGENEEENREEESLNEVVETSSISTRISPNAIIIEKKYYKKCDHLIRTVVDIPNNLVNQTEEEVKKQYSDWKLEGYSSNEIVVYKEFEGICNEHYIVKEKNGILAVYVENSDGIQEWEEDTEIEVQYLPEEDIEEFKVGVKVVGRINLSSFLENYE